MSSKIQDTSSHGTLALFSTSPTLRLFVPHPPYPSQHFQQLSTIPPLIYFQSFSIIIKNSRANPDIRFGIILMGSCKEERGAIHEKPQMVVKTCIACLCSFLISMVGGLILVWWEVEYHPSNSQQWMVPFGLIMFATPVIIWFSVVLSDIWNSDADRHIISSLGEPVLSPDNLVHDPER